MAININFTGRHNIDVTEALNTFTHDKFSRLERHSERIQSVDVIFDLENHSQVVEATILIDGAKLHARSHDKESMYTAIDCLIDKLDRQLIKFKEKQNDHRLREKDRHLDDDQAAE